MLTASEYKFAIAKYDTDTEKQHQRLDAAIREKAEFAQSSTPADKWLTAISRFMDAKELTAEMTQALIECVEVSSRDRVSVTLKFRDEFAAICQYSDYTEVA